MMEQVGQRSYAVSVLGGFKDLTGQSPEWPGLIPQLTLV